MARAAPRTTAPEAREPGADEASASSASRERRVGASHHATADAPAAAVTLEPDIESLFGHQPAALVELADAFLEQLDALPRELEGALSAADLEGAERVAHSLKPAAVLFGELTLAGDATTWQELALAGEAERLASSLAHARDACGAAAERVRARRDAWARRVPG